MNDYARTWIGASIDQLQALGSRRDGNYVDKIKWQEKTYALPNGNTAYIVPERADCSIHWEVNKARTIVGYKTEGARCW